jgi:hypothetical protein
MNYSLVITNMTQQNVICPTLEQINDYCMKSCIMSTDYVSYSVLVVLGLLALTIQSFLKDERLKIINYWMIRLFFLSYLLIIWFPIYKKWFF